MTNLNVQFGSDFHLSEYGRCIEDSLDSNPENVLILAGDISLFNSNTRLVKDKNYCEGWTGLIDWLSDNFLFTCMVPGNHEFFGQTLEQGIEFMFELNKIRPDKFIILYNECVHLKNNIWVAGTTLWSYIPPHSFHITADTTKINEWSLEKHNKEHSCAESFLNRTLNSDKKWIVVTHHCPSTFDTSNFLFSIEDNNHAYSSSLEKLIQKSCLWIFGHTHWNVCYKHTKENIGYIISNCQGKKYESTKREYQKNLTLKVD